MQIAATPGVMIFPGFGLLQHIPIQIVSERKNTKAAGTGKIEFVCVLAYFYRLQ